MYLEDEYFETEIAVLAVLNFGTKELTCSSDQTPNPESTNLQFISKKITNYFDLLKMYFCFRMKMDKKTGFFIQANFQTNSFS